MALERRPDLGVVHRLVARKEGIDRAEVGAALDVVVAAEGIAAGAGPSEVAGYEEEVGNGRARVRAHHVLRHAHGPEAADGPGLGMIDAIHEGRLKALFLVGEEIALVDANAHYVQDALQKLDFFAVQDLFFTTTAGFADVVLAAAPSVEKEGTFVNTERRIQRLYRVLDPLGESRPDWEILTDLAKRLGHDWGYRHPGEIMDEVAVVTPLFAGVGYARLAGYRSLCWPVAPDGTDTPLLYTDGFPLPGGKARLYPLEWTEPTDQPDDTYDLHLNTGRLLEHFHEGNMTHRPAGLNQLVPDTFVEVSEALAAERQLETGDWVRLTSRCGSVQVRVLVSDQVRDGELYMPMTSSTHPVNFLTSNEVDPDSHTPAYKEVAVRMERCGPKGKRPLPANHHRYGRPTPQSGVEVERKWARPEYVFPTTESPPPGYDPSEPAAYDRVR